MFKPGVGATGKTWILSEVMIIKYVTRFIECLGWSRYVWMCVCSVSYMVLSLMGGGTPKFAADLDGVYIT